MNSLKKGKLLNAPNMDFFYIVYIYYNASNKQGIQCVINIAIKLFTAMTHMDKLRVFGKAMRVMLSKHQTVQLPKEGQPDAGLTRYFFTYFY